MKRIFLLLGMLFGCTQFLHAQVSVTGGSTAQQMAQMLVGQGVVITNPTLNGACPTDARGKFNFNGNPSAIGIDSGIVLSSGRVVNNGGAFGVANPVGTFASTSWNNPGDPDLNTILANSGSNITTNDACVLEFDFIPSGDTVKFDYVFGSEEYPEYACGSVNDAFGFVISGPGLPAGINNMALVPGTNIPISINSVNMAPAGMLFGQIGNCNAMGAGSPFAMYYVDNQGAGGQHIVYDGFTTVLQAISPVIPCNTYHLKIAIADGGDWSYDSGVFIKAGSLMTTSIKLTPTTGGGQNDNQAHSVRGCKPAKLAFGRSTCDSTVPLTYHLYIAGTAVNGVDYEYLPDTFTVPANTNTDTLLVKALNVQYPPGTPRYAIIGVYHPDSVALGVPNPPIVSQDTVWIYDSLYVNILSNPVTVCPRTEVHIDADIAPGLNYSWTPAALIEDPSLVDITVKPSVTTPYTITVTQPGAPATCPPVKRTYIVNVEPIPQIILTKDSTVCLSDSLNLNVYARPGDIDYTWNWQPSAYLRDNFSPNNKFFAPVGDYKYVVTATTPVAHCSNSDSMLIHVVPPFVFESVTPHDTVINYGDQIQLSSESEAIYWLWSPGTYLSDPLARDPYAAPLENMHYTLIGINQYGCKDTAEINIAVVYQSNSGMPNAFSPNGDGLNDIFKIEMLEYDKITEFRIFNRWGRQVFETNNPNKGWDGSISGQPAPADVYYYQVKITLPNGTQKVIKGDVTLIR